MDLITATWISQAIAVAATLGVADRLAAGPRPVEEIAEALDADPDALYRLLRVLADADVVDEREGRRFALTELGQLLRGDAPGSLRGWAAMVGAPFQVNAWAGLHESVRSGEPAFELVHGRPAMDYLRDHPDDAALLNDGMTAASGRVVAGMMAAYDFGGAETIVDVGGGHGALLAAVLAANPDAHGVLYDLPQVVAGAGPLLEEAGVADRCEPVGGDFFRSVPPGGDAYMLSNVIHDWGDEESRTILANCRAAMADGGRILLAEAVLPEGTEPSPAKLIDLAMLVMGTGRQRSVPEYRELFAGAGLELGRVLPSPGPYSIVEAAPA